MEWYANYILSTLVVTVYFGLGLSLVSVYCERECFDTWLVVFGLWLLWPGLFIVLLLKRLGLEALFLWLVGDR